MHLWPLPLKNSGKRKPNGGQKLRRGRDSEWGQEKYERDGDIVLGPEVTIHLQKVQAPNPQSLDSLL